MSDRRKAVVAVVVEEGRFLLIRRGASVPDPGYWAPVTGVIAPGEAEADAVVREVLEEVGLKVQPVRRVWRCVSAGGTHDLYWWLARPVGGRLSPDSREVAAVRWCSPSEYAEAEPTFPTDRQFFESVFPTLAVEPRAGRPHRRAGH